jgi:hypothetical protein
LIFITLDDETGAFMAVDSIKGCIASDAFCSVVFDKNGAQWPVPFTPAQVRARIDAALGRSIN